jgi:hypothetical protein
MIDKVKKLKNCLTLPYDLCNIMYLATLYMDIYFNTSMDATYAGKYCSHDRSVLSP